MAHDEVARQVSLDSYALGQRGMDLIETVPTATARALARESLAELDRQLVELVGRARVLMQAQGAAVNLMDGELQVPVAIAPGTPSPCPRKDSMCHVVTSLSPVPQVFTTRDATKDHRFADNPWVNGRLGSIRYYVAVPLIGREGLPLGTLCVWSQGPAPRPQPCEKGLLRLSYSVSVALEARRREVELLMLESQTLPPDRSGKSAVATADNWWTTE